MGKFYLVVKIGFTFFAVLFLILVVIYFIGTMGTGTLADRLRPLAKRIGDLVARLLQGKGEGGG